MQRAAKSTTWKGWAFLVIAPFIAAAALLCGSATAGEANSSGARAAQYVFVVDDSGSMARDMHGEKAADPDRLAVFAARSTISMLDDEDEASVVRLNGPRDGEQMAPIEPLSDNREKLEALLSLEGDLAAYDGDYTPCKEAIEAVGEELEEAYRPNVAQVVMFLTDGACTGTDPAPDEVLEGLSSAEDDLFQFYLLRFQGHDYTASLEDFARQTGGTAIEVSADDPSAILQPFADALSASQGYESYLLTPEERRLADHSAARRVRLLAVAPDRGRDLDFAINPARKGETPRVIDAPRKGVHQYENGKRYRYAAVDYRPGEVPVDIDVEGADDWKVVAVPEYRLFVEMTIYDGDCDDGTPLDGFAEVGNSVCAAIELVNEQGETVDSDVADRGTEAVLEYLEPEADQPKELPASRRGDEARFFIGRANLERGDHVFRPAVRLDAPGRDEATVDLKGPAVTLQVSSLEIRARPGSLDFGALAPGGDGFDELDVDGNFPSTRARLVVEHRDEIPECVEFELSGKEEGEAQEITSGQSYKVGVQVAPYCGASSFKREYDTALRIEFDPSSQMPDIPTLVVPLRFSLVSELSTPRVLSASLRAGESAEMDLALEGNFERSADFRAMAAPIEGLSNDDDLLLEFVDDDGVAHSARGEKEGFAVSFAPGEEAEKLRVRASADVCCEGGDYRGEIVMAPTFGVPDPVRVPVELEVEEASVWACWGSTLLWLLGALLLVLLALYLYNMWEKTHLLPKKDLVNRFVLLEWGPTGQPRAAPDSSRRVARFVDKNFTFFERLKAWMKANPLKIGLPNDYEYDETVRITPNLDQPSRSSLKILDRPDHYGRLQERPRHDGLIYASANMDYYAVPDEEGYCGSFHFERYSPPPGGDLEVEELAGRKLLLDDERREEGEFAGFEVNY